MSLLDPFDLHEAQRAREILNHHASGLIEGLSPPESWREDLIINDIAGEIFAQRREALITSQSPRLQEAQRRDPADDRLTRQRNSSEDFHRVPTVDSPDYRSFISRVVRPFFQANHPLHDQRNLAEEIISAHRAGQIGYRDDVLGPQFEEIAQLGISSADTHDSTRRLVVPKVSLDLILALGRSQYPRGTHPSFWIVSYIRLRGNQNSDHFRGYGLDILKYDGRRINMVSPATAFAGVIAVIRNLPAGRYQLGLPRAAVEASDLGAQYDRAGIPVPRLERTNDIEQFRNFFDADDILSPAFRGQSSTFPWALENPFLDRRLREGSARGGYRQDLEVFESAHYRNLFELAVGDAALNGAEIVDVFPDKPNHLHISIQ